ncbi:M23 family metallopeptidase [Novosphingobium soli]|uniref:M23 family metallopeptidase n=1 Tax=Novosphingobium soli TaxID=574956 RepID=A0ABV6D0R6_9SPHN
MSKALKHDRNDHEGAALAALLRAAPPPTPAPTGASVVLAFPQRAASGAGDLPPPAPGLRARLVQGRAAVEALCRRVELAPDLASDIGSRTWWRGLATMLGLGATALAFCPDFTRVEAAAAMPLGPREREEFRSQSIAPLAYGAGSGRRMGATPRVHPLAGVPERPAIQLVSTLAQGDSLAQMLERSGLGAGDAARVAQLVAQAVPAGELAPGTPFDITLGRRPQAGAPRALESLDFRARFDLDLAIRRQAGALVLERRPIAVDATPLRIRGNVGAGLYRSARNAGAPVAAIQSYLRAVDKYLSLESDLKPGDAFDMIVSYRRSAKGERQVGELLYAGVEQGGKPRLQLVRWGKDGQMVPAGAVGQARSVPVGQPVAGRITSPYGARRHPILGYVRMHAGIDFGAAYGSPIHAVAEGVVTFAGRHGGHGNYVRLQHGGGLATGYGHMSRIAVRGGTRVRAGQVIGYVGSTGLSTGPHLHFEAYRGGRTINPAKIAIVARPQIDGRERDAFKARLRALLAVAPGAALAPLAPEQGPGQGLGQGPGQGGGEQPRREIDKLAD